MHNISASYHATPECGRSACRRWSGIVPLYDVARLSPPEGELKRKDEELIAAAEKLTATVEEKTLIVVKLVVVHAKLDKTRRELSDLHKGFDEEEYANRPLEEDEEVVDVEVKVAGAKAEKEPKAGEEAT
ncbi:hypothetical protein Acr_23g0007620 [Actinidia rufa]|uniref:Uncharacterized protein n=1 Tax=Actinidia rufa TaxID=165716 RepID=A0A7J0GNJ0_9ERIC|nr:hypothetical protein Acr_23g0007620 [Actinidia rufa]